MFNSKKIEQLEKRVEIIEARKELIVECEECGCLLLRENAKEVEVVSNSFTLRSRSSFEYYCKIHKPNYDKVERWGFEDNIYYKKEVSVDEKGKPIK